jgi:hypothetical protein
MRVTRDTYEIAKTEWQRIDAVRAAKRSGVSVIAYRARCAEDDRMAQIAYYDEQVAQVEQMSAGQPELADALAPVRASWTERRQALIDGFFS